MIGAEEPVRMSVTWGLSVGFFYMRASDVPFLQGKGLGCVLPTLSRMLSRMISWLSRVINVINDSIVTTPHDITIE